MRDHESARSREAFTATMVFVVVFWLVDLFVLRAGAPDPLDDSWEYLSVARALLEGHGFRTPVIHPPLWSLRDAALTVPVLVHGPLLPVLLAPFVALFGESAAHAIPLLAALFATLAAAVTQRLGARTMGSAVGSAGAVLFTLSPLVIRAVHHDIALTFGALALVTAMDRLLRTRPHAIRAGLALGLGLLARPEYLLAAPVLALFAPRARVRFLAAFAACGLPWWWHGVANAGSPFFNLSSYLLIGYWGERPGIAVMRDFALPPRAWPQALREALPHLPPKWLDFFPHALKCAIQSPSAATGWLAPIGALAATQESRARSLAAGAALLALIPLATMTVTLYDPRYLTPFLACAALFAARGASEMVGFLPRWAHRPRTWVTLLMMLAVPGAGMALHDAWREGALARTRWHAERAGLAVRFAEAHPRPRLVFTDPPDFVAWTTRRAALWMSAEEYAALPLADSTGAAPHDRPARSPNDVVWFHAAEGRGGVLLVDAPGRAATPPAPPDTTAAAAARDSTPAAAR
ncbi:MAG: hypothetical protein U0704_00570 [Candidatus Eisenbacteria bacterium]